MKGLLTDRIVLEVFALTALTMLAFEGLKELLFEDAHIPWQAHLITVLATALLALGVGILVRQHTLRLAAPARHARSRTHRFLETLLDAIPVAVFYKDREGRYLGCNALFSETLGMSEREIHGIEKTSNRSSTAATTWYSSSTTCSNWRPWTASRHPRDRRRSAFQRCSKPPWRPGTNGP